MTDGTEWKNGMTLQIECHGDSPEALRDMAVREAAEFFYADHDDIGLEFGLVTPKHQKVEGSVVEWECEVMVWDKRGEST